MKVLLIIILMFRVSVQAQDNTVDDLAVAKLLIKDGYFSRAEKILNKPQSNRLDKALFESLLGMVALHKKNYEKSIEYFQRSIASGMKKREVYIYLSESYLKLGDIPSSEKALSKVSENERRKLPFFLLSAEIRWKKNDKLGAWKFLNQASNNRKFRDMIDKKKFSYYMEGQLFFAAYNLVFKFMKRGGSWRVALAMASQLRLKHQNNLSLKILQALALKKPYNSDIALEMTQNYLALGEEFSGLIVLEEAVRTNRDLAFEASVLLRQMGKSYRARYMNLHTLDPKKRLKQKISLHLEADDYHSMKLMVPELNKHQLLQDEELQYAVAYSLFRTGDFNASEKYLKLIQRDDLFEKSLRLRDEISKCRDEHWACRETI